MAPPDCPDECVRDGLCASTICHLGRWRSYFAPAGGANLSLQQGREEVKT